MKSFIIAGEKSGDLHGSHLLRELKKLFPEGEFSGIAGPLMRKEGLTTFSPMENLQVMGFTDVIKALPSIYKQFKNVAAHILKEKPDLVVFIDYPGFNLRLAKHLKKKGFEGKLIHYISPSVWAWDSKRIDLMAKVLDKLLIIFPFEASYYKKTTLAVDYVGNPLYNYLNEYAYNPNWKTSYPQITDKLIALFPGSRLAEIKRNLKNQLMAASLFQKNHPEASFGISCTNEDLKPEIEALIKQFSLKNSFVVDQKFSYELMKDSHSAIAKSGTVTLELALHKRPTVVMYELSFLNRFIAKYIIRLKLASYCIVNILSNKRIFPEMIEEKFDAYKLALALETLDSGAARENCLKDCELLESSFKGKMASLQAAMAIKETL